MDWHSVTTNMYWEPEVNFKTWEKEKEREGERERVREGGGRALTDFL